MTTEAPAAVDLWDPLGEPAPPPADPGEVSVEIDLTKPKEVAYGTATAVRLADGVEFTHTGDFTKEGTRRTFARGTARAFFPLPDRGENEGPGAHASRVKAVEASRSAAEAAVGRLLQAEVTRLRAERRERERLADELAAGQAALPGQDPRPLVGTPDAPKVLCDVVEHEAITAVIDAMAGDADLYHRAGALVRVLRGQGPTAGVLGVPGPPTIGAMPAANLRDRITKHVTLTGFRLRGREMVEEQIHPPKWLVEGVAGRGEWPGIRPLAGISDTPVLRPDGSVCQERGYDVATGVLYEPSRDFPTIHPDVGIDEAADAWEALREVVADFKFEGPEHRAAWLAGLLTILARFAFAGNAPLFAVDANIRGAGKGLCVDAIGQIVLGRNMPVTSYTQDDDEMRKLITSIALAGDRVVHLDNIEGQFGSPSIDRALTGDTWGDRVLGKSEKPTLALNAVWFCTGNNIAVAADTARRIIHVKLDVLEERPEERRGFRHPKLRQWLARERPRLLTAALTILVAYCRAGRPDMNLPPYGSFEDWSDLVRQAVVWIGERDPCDTRVKLVASADTTADTLAQVIAAFEAYDSFRRGIVVSEMLARLYPAEKQYQPRADSDVQMRAAIELLTNAQSGKPPTARQVGANLRKFKRRRQGDRMLDSIGKGEGGSRWHVVSLTEQPISADSPD